MLLSGIAELARTESRVAGRRAIPEPGTFLPPGEVAKPFRINRYENKRGYQGKAVVAKVARCETAQIANLIALVSSG
jgi:hypothetical protein